MGQNCHAQGRRSQAAGRRNRHESIRTGDNAEKGDNYGYKGLHRNNFFSGLIGLDYCDGVNEAGTDVLMGYFRCCICCTEQHREKTKKIILTTMMMMM